MAEFKISSGIDKQISAFQNAGSELNASYSAADSSGVETLKTAVAFIEEQKQLKTLLALYASLISKDSTDLTAMAETARQADSAAAGSYSG